MYFFRRIPVKIVLITLLCLFMLLLGAIPITVVMVMDQAMVIRVLIGAIGPIWALGSIIFILSKTRYFHLFQLLKHKRKANKMGKTRSRYPEYEALYAKYPLAIGKYERHCRHHNPPIKVEQMVRNVLKVNEEEWQAREQFIKDSLS